MIPKEAQAKEKATNYPELPRVHTKEKALSVWKCPKCKRTRLINICYENKEGLLVCEKCYNKEKRK